MDPNPENLIGIFTTDTDLKIQIWDAALERMTGVSAGDALGRSITDIVPDMEQRSLLQRFHHSLSHGTIEVLAPAFHRYLIKCPPLGPSKHFKQMRQQVRIAPLKEGDTIKGLIVSVEDVTQRMEREIETAALLKDADEQVRLNAARTISASEDVLDGNKARPIIEGLGDPSWRVRRSLVEGMSRRAAPDAIQALLNALKERHLDFGVVNSALQILRANAVDTTGTLTEFLKADETDLRMHAALALGEQDDPTVASALIAALHDQDINVRYHAIEALGKLKAAEAVEPLLAVIDEQDFFLSFAALDALAEIGDTSTGPRILPLLENELFREATLRVITTIGTPNDITRIIELLNKERTLTNAAAAAAAGLLRRFQDDASSREKMLELARQALDARGPSNLLTALDAAKGGVPDELLSLAGWFDDEGLINKLVALLADDDTRDRAASALVTQGGKAVDALTPELENEDAEVRRMVVRVLGQIGDIRAIRHLAKLIDTGDPGDRREAVDALALFNDAESAELLVQLAESSDPRIREAALRGLGRSVANRNYANAVINGCTDPDERVRQAALEQLPGIIGDKAVAILAGALQKDAPRIRAAAAQGLARIDSGESIAALRLALSDDDPWTRYFAVRGIGSLRDVSSAEALRTLVENDPAEQVRIAAREVMIELGL